MIKTGKCKVWVPVPGLFLIFVLLVPVLILLGYHMASRPHVLLVREVNSGRELRVGYLNQGEKFEIRYIHSVDRLPVYEEFQLINGELVLTGTRFLSFGAGLGTPARDFCAAKASGTSSRVCTGEWTPCH